MQRPTRLSISNNTPDSSQVMKNISYPKSGFKVNSVVGLPDSYSGTMSITDPNNKAIEILNPIDLIQEANVFEEEASPTKIKKEEEINSDIRKSLAESFKKKTTNFLTLENSNRKFLKTSRFFGRKKVFAESPRVKAQALMQSSLTRVSQAYHIAPVLSPRRAPIHNSFKDSFPKSTASKP